VVQVLARRKAPFSVREVVERSGVSRQAAHRELSRLVRAGELFSEGRGRATRYAAGTQRTPSGRTPPAGAVAFRKRYRIDGLAEDRVWQELRPALSWLARPSAKNAQAVVAYALTEMVNNAIDHSRAKEVSVRAGGDGKRTWFEVEDAGIGAFENVRSALGLTDALAGLQEISKGKLSTQPAQHSGEGIFFTSKMADRFDLAANGLLWLVDNLRGDQAVGTEGPRRGTLVRFEIDDLARPPPQEVFRQYTHDFEFDTTRTVVKLFAYGVRFVSRSEAKRLLDGLERFRQIILDFSGVEAVGQGFADEIFRVWASQHPEIEVRPENMTDPVAFMVERARRARPSR
jgi:anti-sigma regulatory factor (Ser/Thr protein kinase)